MTDTILFDQADIAFLHALGVKNRIGFQGVLGAALRADDFDRLPSEKFHPFISLAAFGAKESPALVASINVAIVCFAAAGFAAPGIRRRDRQ